MVSHLLHFALLLLPAVGMVAARPAAGVDWGVVYDASSVVLVYRVAGIRELNPEHDGRPVFVAIPYVFAPGTPLHEVVDSIVRWTATVPIALLGIETNGVGSMPSQEVVRRLREVLTQSIRINLVATTAAKKTAAMSLVLALMERGQLLLLRHPDLQRQLAGMRYEIGHRGHMSIEASEAAVHDDCVDALGQAMLPISQDGRVVCAMQRLADPRYAPPETPLPPNFDGGGVIETGSGLRVFRNLPLQSINGAELTFTNTHRPGEPVRIGSLRYQPQTGRSRS